MNNKINPSIWISTNGGNVAEVLEYYQRIFDKDFQQGEIIPLGETPSDNSEICDVYIYGQKYIFMSTAKEHHLLNDAVSFIINCEDQNEIDKFWNYFTKEGEEYECGWCIDKFGLRWQVLPANLAELMSKPNAFEVMMKQKKIIIAEYLR